MMVETILESPTDLGMSDGAGGLPQWKREVLLRRAARGQPGPRSTPAPPAVPLAPPPDDEELRYGPGIVKRLQSRYLSLALRDQPRRRPSVLRRAASLDLLPAEPPARVVPPAPRYDPPAAPRLLPRDAMKRARSVDVLGRPETYVAPPPPPPPPGPPAWSRPPRRAAPLLRPSERPPPDVVRAALRKFECRPRRAGPEQRLRLVEPATLEPDADLPRPPRPPSATNAVLLARHSSPRRVGIIRPMPAVPREESPSTPPATVETPIEPPATADATEKPFESTDKPRKLSESVDTPTKLFESADTPRNLFESADIPTKLFEPAEVPKNPFVAAEDPRKASIAAEALRKPSVASEVPIIPSVAAEVLRKPSVAAEALRKPSVAAEALRKPSVSSEVPIIPSVAAEVLRKPSVAAEVLRKPSVAAEALRKPSVAAEALRKSSAAADALRKPSVAAEALRKSSVAAETLRKPSVAAEALKKPSVAAEALRKPSVAAEALRKSSVAAEALRQSSPGPLGVRLRGASPAGGTSVVFNFCSRPDVPDYIENDGLHRTQPESEEERDGGGATSPCVVRFVNDNVLINGRSSLSGVARDKLALKLQFDDSLTVTFEYPSENSLLDDEVEGQDTPPDTPVTHHTLPNNAVLGASSLSSYQPCKSSASSFQLGLTRPQPAPLPAALPAPPHDTLMPGACGEDATRAHSFSHSRDMRTDLLF